MTSIRFNTGSSGSFARKKRPHPSVRDITATVKLLDVAETETRAAAAIILAFGSLLCKIELPRANRSSMVVYFSVPGNWSRYIQRTAPISTPFS